MSAGPELLILAGGMGSRYKGLKQLDEFGPNGESLMEYSLFDAKRAGFSRVIFLIREEVFNLLREKILVPYADLIEMDVAFQKLDDLPENFTPPETREKPWGTGQAVWSARHHITKPFAVINADDFYSPQAFEKLSKFLMHLPNDSSSFGLVAYELGGTLSDQGCVNRGIIKTKEGLLVSVEEKLGIEKLGAKKSDAENLSNKNQVEGPNYATVAQSETRLELSDLVSVNCWAFSPKIFSLLEKDFVGFLKAEGDQLKSEFFLPTVLDLAVNQDQAQVEVMTTTGKWMGVTYPTDKEEVVAQLAKMHKETVYPPNLKRY
ncbi:MAG: nucleotidyltransferase [SAR324 cluster bacterium]|nr:nucleotidyltransferase [SAR324 cluster bacterium]